MTISIFLLLSAVLIISPLVVAEASPRNLVWSSSSYGPDGPWQAVTVDIGSPSQSIDLSPGGSWQSYILASSICENKTTSSTCYSQAAGLYNFSASSTLSNFTVPFGTSADIDPGFGVMSSVGTAALMFDQLSLSDVGYSTAVISNLSMFVIEDAWETLPGGQTFTQQVGSLALGSASAIQTFGNGAMNASLLPGALYDAGEVPSNSYGLHIGSAALNIPGSLYIGGYDQSRVLGTVTAQSAGSNFLQIDLLDIGIGVAEGGSPFNYTSRSGILASGNSSIGASLPFYMDTTAPYLYLPQSTCDAIATDLPVTYSSDLGLYLWDTTSSQYKTIVTSPAYLSFTFRLNRSNTQNTTINVPFALLNLNLTAPLSPSSSPTPYFPCRPLEARTYTLGRAFFQAAFLGVNWQTSNNEGMSFLAQAPGPNTPSTAVVTSIGATDDSITASTNEWLDSWKGAWTPLASDSTSTSTPANPSGTSTSTSNSGSGITSHGLSDSAKIGIETTAGVVGAALAILAMWCCRRHRKRVKKTSTFLVNDVRTRSGEVVEVVAGAQRNGSYSDSGWGPRELEGGSAGPSELGSEFNWGSKPSPSVRRSERYELG